MFQDRVFHDLGAIGNRREASIQVADDFLQFLNRIVDRRRDISRQLGDPKLKHKSFLVVRLSLYSRAR
jgi:hypothetical protein